MQKPSPAARPRTGGGMNSNLGNFSGEHFDEGLMQDAAKQKALASAAADPGQMPTSGISGQNKSSLSTNSQQAKPRPIDTKKELKWMAEDVVKGIGSFFDINGALGIDPIKDSPEDKVKKQQMHKRYQEMNQEDRAYVDKLYQEKMKAKQLEEQNKEEERIKKEKEEDNQIIMPSSPKKGPVGPGGSGKKRAVAQLEQDRKGIGKVAGAN